MLLLQSSAGPLLKCAIRSHNPIVVQFNHSVMRMVQIMRYGDVSKTYLAYVRATFYGIPTAYLSMMLCTMTYVIRMFPECTKKDLITSILASLLCTF